MGHGSECCDGDDQKYGSKRILEIGAGANPTIPVTTLQGRNLVYTVNDISADELEKAGPECDRLCFDFSCGTVPDAIRGKYDFVFSRMVNEHVQDGERYYRNIFDVLDKGGMTVHWYSTLYAFPFVINRFTPEWLSSALLAVFSSRDRVKHDKFKAYYSWGRGPSVEMQRGFESIGYEIVDFAGYFGHSYYRRRLPPLHRLEEVKARWLVKHPVPALTSYARVILRKP